MRAKAFAPVNLALIKYWGKVDEELRLPANSSLSVNLSQLGTTTAVEFKQELKTDRVVIDGQEMEGDKKKRVVGHLNRVRQMAKIDWRAVVESKNEIPMGVGLSSSASGMAALSLAAVTAVNLKLKTKDLSRLARLGSGSACRSIADGWVEWVKGSGDGSSYARTVFPAKWWDVRILVVMLNQQEKKVSSTEGQRWAKTSPLFKIRVKGIEKKMERMKEIINRKDFSGLGEMIEAEALELHAVMLTSKPSLVYWLPETVGVMRRVKEWRDEGLESYFTINTGQNVFILCEPRNERKLVERLRRVEGVVEVRREKIGIGARVV